MASGFLAEQAYRKHTGRFKPHTGKESSSHIAEDSCGNEATVLC